MSTMPSSLVLASVAAFVCVLMAVLGLVGTGNEAGARYERRFRGEVSRKLEDMLLFIDAGRLLRVNVIGALLAAALVWWLAGSVFLSATAAIVVLLLPGLVLSHLAKRRRERFAEQLPDALQVVSGAIRAGASVPLALRQMANDAPAPCGQEFDLMLRELQLGVTLDDAMRSLERRMGGDDLRLFTAAARIAGESGGNLAETLERLSDTIRRKQAIEQKIQSLTSQGRLQGWVMVALPIAVALALFAIEPASMQPLLDTWQGWLVCAVVAVLEGIGLMLIRRIVDIDV